MPDQSDDWRRALEVLANSPEGATEALLFAHGFMHETITGLLDSGLAISTTDLGRRPHRRGNAVQDYRCRPQDPEQVGTPGCLIIPANGAAPLRCWQAPP